MSELDRKFREYRQKKASRGFINSVAGFFSRDRALQEKGLREHGRMNALHKPEKKDNKEKRKGGKPAALHRASEAAKTERQPSSMSLKERFSLLFRRKDSAAALEEKLRQLKLGRHDSAGSSESKQLHEKQAEQGKKHGAGAKNKKPEHLENAAEAPGQDMGEAGAKGKKPGDGRAEKGLDAKPDKGKQVHETGKQALAGKTGFRVILKRMFGKKGAAKGAEKPAVRELDIRKLFHKKKQEKREKASATERKRRLAVYLEKAGLETDQTTVNRWIFNIALAVTALLTAAYIYSTIQRGGSLFGLVIQLLIIWVIGFLLVWGAIRLFFRIYLDLLMFNRKLSVEEVLPDFLQLTSANLRAGMPIDRALWFAVRPRFGVLAREIEDVAKRTLAGEDLHEALLNFARKYDSQVLLRSVYLLNEGMEAGGDVGDLLNKIALNIIEMRGLKKEMAANVTTYVIFISFAAMIAAPFLFALSNQLLSIVQTIASDVAAGGVQRGVGLTINISDENIKMADYKIFAYTCLTIGSIFSGVIVATIKKGNVREGLQYIPVFLIVALIVYAIASRLLDGMLGGIF